MVRSEGPLLRPHGPDDAGEFVRDGDGGDVVAAALFRLRVPTRCSAVGCAAAFACQRTERAPWISSIRR